MANFKLFGDFSSFQNNTYDYMKGLKDKGLSGAMVKTTQSNNYTNPNAIGQFTNGLSVFGQVGVYHFLTQNPTANAKHFLNYIENTLRVTKDTVIGVDVESSMNKYDNILNESDITGAINTFLDIVYDAGFHSLVLYASKNWFQTIIDIKRLKHDPYLWVANYGVSEPGINGAGAHQFTDNWHGIDCSRDFDGLITGKKEVKQPAKKKPTYWQYGRLFKIKSDLKIYEDINFKRQTEGIYKKGSLIFITKVIKPNGKDAELSRFQVDGGYASANTAFSKRIK
ncbi:GH25 family lysozyme [Apilactobacillus timberlakei]|uniref:GH25 family lysozyme n=1 Tax=Apilactobacillus timberlakei TaxID=2008380 RepID=UPI001126C3E6|nr:GH25 family lysozyme [Apilactobacillus timberlakei]TPR12245.1 hypothetical protein DYZ97_07125 [Apilactobacillus timberlakei]